ncbi:MAG: hypothetical protein K2Y37_16720 [Pirellulales bacterium]|nr:hypothetical protein [Pirellulales bacterium]
MTDTTRRTVALGWQLEAAEVVLLEVSGSDGHLSKVVDAIDSARALFLSCDAVSRLWDRAIGGSPRRFRSAAREDEAWQGLAELLAAVRRFLDRDGVLFCRLDLPSPACRVAKPIEHALFPRSAKIDCYDALAQLHPLLGELAAGRGAVAEPDVELVDAAHPARGYLAQFHGAMAPAIAWRDAASAGRVLASTPTGLAVAAAAERVVCVPRLARSDPGLEAAILLEVIDALSAGGQRLTIPVARRSPAPHSTGSLHSARVPRLEALRRQETELTRQIAALEVQRSALATRRELAERHWLNPSQAGSEPLATRLEYLLALLGFLGLQGQPTWKLDETTANLGDTVPALGVAQPEPYARGSIELNDKDHISVVWLNRSVSTDQADAEDPTVRQAVDVASAVGAVVVPLPELSRAASALVLAGGNEDVARAIRKSLLEASGVFRFSPGAALLTKAERKLLQAG